MCCAGFLKEAVLSLAGRESRRRPCGKVFPGREGSLGEDLPTELAQHLWRCRAFGCPWAAGFWGPVMEATCDGWVRATPVKPCFVS